MDQPLDLDALLAEESWIRRLARDLVVDEASADDVTQEVVAAALRQQPSARGVQLRAWLRTVTRRTASRLRKSEAVRRRAEHGAARPEGVEGDARARLRLHRRLNEAIDTLPPLYRTALVLRYLQDLPPREIAQRLGVPATTARKRVSRGLGLLREQLDEEFDERRNWLAALGPIAFGDGWRLPEAGASGAAVTTGAGPLLALAPMKKLVIGGVLAATLVIALVRSFDAPRDPDVQAESGAGTPASLVTPRRGSGAEALEAGSETSAARRALDAPEATRRGPRLLVVDEAGAPVADARAAWIDRRRVAQALELDGHASAALPDDASGGTLLAGARGFATGFMEVERADTDVTLVLGSLVTLRGRVEVDGGPPQGPLTLARSTSDKHLGLAPDYETRRRQLALLAELGLLSSASRTTTRDDGSFEFENVHPRDSGILILPDSYRFLGDPFDPIERYALPANDLVLRTTRVPYLSGTVVWDDDGTPLEGDLLVTREKSGRGHGIGTSMSIWKGGHFEIGLLRADPADPSSPQEHSAINVTFVPDDGFAAEPDRRFELAGHELPWDVGEIRIERAPRLALLVLDAGGAPVHGASVFTDTRRQTQTDAQGRAALATEDAAELSVVAAGHAPRLLALAELDTTDELVVRLDPGAMLRVTTEDLELDPELSVLPTLVLAFQPSAFGHGLGDHDAAASWIQRLFRTSFGASARLTRSQDGPWKALFPVTGEPLELLGLRPGAKLDALLIDAFGNELVRESVVLRQAPEITQVTLGIDARNAGSLTIEVADELNRPLDEAWLLARIPGIGSRGQAIKGSSITLAPVALGEYELSASAKGHLDARSLGRLDGGAQTVQLVLPRARALRLRLEDEHGAPAHPDWVVVRSLNGWSTGREWHPGNAGVSIDKAPLEALEAYVRLGTRTTRHRIETSADEAVVRLPSHGSLRISLDAPPKVSSTWGELVLEVRELDGAPAEPFTGLEEWILSGYPEASAQLSESYTRDAVGALELTTRLRPGRYAVEVLFLEGDGEDAVRRSLLATEVAIEADDETLVEVPD